MLRVSAGLAASLLLSLAIGGVAEAEEELTVYRSFAEFGEPLYPDDFPHFDYVNPDAPNGGEITLGGFGTFETLNTIVLGGQWPLGIGLTSDTLMTGSSDELASHYPLIAEHVAVPDDLSYAVFTIDARARFHDGHPITAEDFKFAFDTIMDNGRPFLRAFFEDITSATVVSEREIRFDFRTTEAWKSVALAASMQPLPVHYWQEEGRDVKQSFLEPPLADGPYRIVSVDPGSSITYERVEDYWAADLPVNVGQYNFDRITYDYYRNDDALFAAFSSGEIDFRLEYRSQRWATGYDFPAVDDGDVIQEALPDNTPQGIQGYVLNTRRPQFEDIRVRQALTQLFDFEWTRKNLFYGNYTRTRSYFPNSDFGVGDFGPPEGQELAFLEPFRDQLPPELFSQVWEPPVTDGSGNIRPQLDEATRLLTEAGWEISDGVLTHTQTGEPFAIEFTLIAADATERIVQAFARNLERAGIQVSIRAVDAAQYERVVNEFDYDIISVRSNFFPPPGPEQRSYWGSAAADTIGSANWAGIRNPVIDALIEEVVTARDIETLKAANRALDRVLLWNYYMIPQFHQAEAWVAYWNVFERPDRLPHYSTGFPDTWWFETGSGAQQTQR